MHETVSTTTNHGKILTRTAKSCVGKPCWNFLPSHRPSISPSLSSSLVLASFAMSHVDILFIQADYDCGYEAMSRYHISNTERQLAM